MRNKWLTLFTLSSLILMPSLYGATIVLTGSLPRGQASSLTLNIEIRGVAASELQVGAKARILESFELNLVNHTNSDKPVALPGQKGSNYLDTYSSVFLTEPYSNPNATQDSYIITMVLRIDDNGAVTDSLKTLIEENGQITIAATYAQPDGETAELNPTAAIKQESNIANQKVAAFQARATHKSLIFTWQNETSIAYNNAGDSKAPTGVNIILVDTSKISSYEFAAKTFQENASEEKQDASCTFTASNSSCELQPCTNTEDPSADAYLDINELLENPVDGITVRQENVSGNAVFVDLSESVEYAAFAQFRPDSILLSDCRMATPGRNYSVSELNGAGEASAGNPNCFIATAAYGSELHPKVALLRWFRDRFLMGHGPGRLFVASYYKWSPIVARKIEGSSALKKVVRGGLWPLVGYLTLLKEAFWLTMLGTVFAMFLMVIKAYKVLARKSLA